MRDERRGAPAADSRFSALTAKDAKDAKEKQQRGQGSIKRLRKYLRCDLPEPSTVSLAVLPFLFLGVLGG
jgi:hypothetical protein